MIVAIESDDRLTWSAMEAVLGRGMQPFRHVQCSC